MSSAYDSLDPRVRKWVYKQGWSTLRPLQESSIPAILARDRDVLISAGTAAGKTEAFFLPACSAVADLTNGFGIVYISPLKALINDQYRRLESKRAARTVLTGRCYSVGNATRQGSSSLTRFIGQSAMTSRT